MSSAISMRNVSKSFVRRSATAPDGTESFTALDNVSLDIASGEFLAIVGPSGCGKSTLLDLLGGLTNASSGRILIDDLPITGPALDRGVVFQQYALFPWKTAQGNVEFSLEAKGFGKRQRAVMAQEFIALVGLEGFEDRYPHELSGGMKQRVAIARSLAHDPKVLLMDEPFAALDAQTRETMQAELLRIWRSSGKTIVFITHGIDEAAYLGRRVAVMTSRPGRIKCILDVPETIRSGAEDVRSTSEFASLRHEIWTALRDETHRAEALERSGAFAASAPREIRV